jgi:hypothetical protein
MKNTSLKPRDTFEFLNRTDCYYLLGFVALQFDMTFRIYRVQMMAYNTQSHWVSGHCLTSGILNTSKHNVSGSGSVSIFRWGEGDTYSVGSLKKSQPQSLDPRECAKISYINPIETQESLDPWASCDSRTHEDSSSNWGAGMPKQLKNLINRSDPH